MVFMVTLYKVVYAINSHFKVRCVVYEQLRELDVLTRWHRSFKQEVIYIQGAKFKRGGGGGGGGEGDLFVSICDEHTLLLQL